jgi:hypothetical protein
LIPAFYAGAMRAEDRAEIEAYYNRGEDWQAVLDTVRATERVPELLGVGPHLLVTAVREGGAGG